jgi:putative thioredoxin
MDTTTESFDRDVVGRSYELPVMVDFWAPWCGPCRLLEPVLEKLVEEYGGQFLVARVNIDDAPELAARFGVMSIPTVIGFRDGVAWNSFVGAPGESVVRAFVEGLMPTRWERLAKEAASLEGEDAGAAEAKYREAIALAGPLDAAPRIGMARVLLAQNRVEESRAVIEELEKRGYLEPEAEKLKGQITLSAGATEAGPLDAARAAVSANPRDLTARYRLAEALAAAGQHGEALEIALDLVERDRRGVGEEARKLMLAIFSVLPPESELAAEFRRRLSVVL